MYVQLGDQAKVMDINVDLTDDCSSTQLQLVHGSTGQKVGVSYMQALTSTISLGGQASYLIDKNILEPSYAGIYDHGEHQVAACYDQGKEVGSEISHTLERYIYHV